MKDKPGNYIKSLFCLILFLLSVQSNKSQESILYSTVTAPVDTNTISFGTNKLINTYQFFGNAVLDFNALYGKIDLVNTYNRTLITSLGASTRDDELFSFLYSLPVFNTTEIYSLNNFMLSSDSRSFGINSLSRLNSSIGLKHYFFDKTSLSLSAGYENNKQVGVISPGTLLNSRFTMPETDIFDVTASATAEAQYLKLNLDRNNTDLDLHLNVRKSGDSSSILGFAIAYKLQNRDYLSPIAGIDTTFIPVESRLEKTLNANFSILYPLSPALIGNFNFSAYNNNVSRSFKNYMLSNNYTGIYRNLNELQLSFDAGIRFLSDNFSQYAALFYNIRNEANNISRKFDISHDEFTCLRQQENMRDNSMGRTRLLLQSKLQVSRSDSVSFDYSVSILRYDTPSQLNYDDRDEFNNVTVGKYWHNFSSFLSAGLTAEVQLLHIVFLKSQNSAMNRWNRIIRFAPEVRFKTEGFSMDPQFEVLANYTVYDYEDQNPGVSSFSYRQIAYKDTIYISLGNKLSLQSQINIRYYERGVLFWHDFSESPQYSNYEHFTKLLIFTESFLNTSIGCGGRVYLMNQRNLGADAAGSNGQRLFFYGPEVAILATFSSGSTISLQGWYEIQYSDNVLIRKIPNFYFQTKVVL
jgi:hypothetical protein